MITQIFKLSTTWVEYEFTGLPNEVFSADPPPVDLNNDGNLDVILHGGLIPGFNQQPDGPQQGLILLGQDGGGFVVADGDRPQTESARYTEYADFNNDGYLDILTVDHGWDAPPSPGLKNQLLLSDGSGGFTNGSHLLPDFMDFAHGLALADVDNDGDIDAFVSVGPGGDTLNNYFLINEGPGMAFTPNFDFIPDSISSSVGRGTQTSAFGDMNNDGFADLIVGRNYEPTTEPHLRGSSVIFWGDGTGRFSDANSTNLPDAADIWAGIAHDMQPVDVDGDGDLDLMNYFSAIPELSDTGEGWAIQLLINHGDGVFIDETSDRIAGRTSSEYGALSFLHMNDLNGDGLMDFRPSVYSYWIEQADELVLQILATGNGTFETLTLGQIAAAHGVPENFDGAVLGFDQTAFESSEMLYSTSQGEALWSAINSSGYPSLYLAQFTEVQSTIIDLTLQANAHTPNWTGYDGNDLLIGDGGQNHLSGQNGNDQLIGSSGNDILIGGIGDDRLDGGDDADNLDGGSGNDTLIAGSGADNVFDPLGNDDVDAGAGHDQIILLSGKNIAHGGTGNDLLIGGIQGDALFGAAGNDVIRGDVGSGISGSADIISGGADDDILMGGIGADVFVFATNDGLDVIASFDVADVVYNSATGYSVNPASADFQVGVDHIQLESFATVNSTNVLSFVSSTAQGAVFNAEGTDITFYGVDAASITADDFLFV
ncbi:MAG: VCBS repeat-containing protein [Rhodobacteraceae bacterium]|nr:VCBS repeat-containing protein [Paracoccaceae bacterium]